MPLYVFSAQQIEVSGFLQPSEADPHPKSPYPEARTKVGAFWRCGPHRAKFMSESVWDLKKTLDKSGSGLCIRAGRLAEVIEDAVQFFEKDPSTLKVQEQGKIKKESQKSDSQTVSDQRAEIVGVWMTAEVTTEEQEDENAIRNVVEAHGKEFRLFDDEKYFIDE
jgi:deoxyribodipyrimidine photo-lyase